VSFRVAIVGRPNVGKSTLFNRVLRRRRSLVHDLPGMTRDPLEEDVRLPGGESFVLVDTGGFDPSEKGAIGSAVFRRAVAAIESSDLALLVIDASAGVLPADREAARRIRETGKPCLVVANKIDRRAGEEGEPEAWALGFPEVFGVSAEHNRGIDELLDEIAARAGLRDAEPAETPDTKVPLSEISVAVVGRPNVGKSSLLNAIVGFEREIVSEQAGTTRDSVDVVVSLEGQPFRFIDTAGIRRRGKTEKGPEVLSVVAARKRLERCDVVLAVFDAQQGPTSQDSTVASYAVESGKALLLVGNKWDLAAEARKDAKELRLDVAEKFPFAKFAPLFLVSARTGRGVRQLPKEILKAAESRERRLPTAEINRIVEEEFRGRTPKGESGRPLKILYASQTGTAPPTFSLVSSRAEKLYFSDSRRLENALRRAGGFEATPIVFHVTERRRKG
jgi:GTP-binding protein